MQGIVRVKKKTSNYTMLDKRFLDDPLLGWGAKGLLGYLLSKPDDWKIMVNHLVKQSADGRDATRARMRELQREGYMRRRRVVDPNTGRVLRWEIIVFETRELAQKAQDDQPGLFERIDAPQAGRKPCFSSNSPEAGLPHLDLPHLEKPDLEKPDLENRPVLNNDGSKDRSNQDRRTNKGTAVVALLLQEGLRGADALSLAASYTERQILDAIAYTNEQCAAGKVRKRRAYLVSAIKGAYRPEGAVRIDAASDEAIAQAAELERERREMNEAIDALGAGEWQRLLSGALAGRNALQLSRRIGSDDPRQVPAVRHLVYRRLLDERRRKSA